MTRTPASGPGKVLLRLAHVIFHAHALDSAVVPTIADLRQEWHEASSRRGRLAARWRGYRAFWALAMRAPFVFPPDPAALPRTGLIDPLTRAAAWAIAIAAVASWWVAAGPWALALIPGSLLVAVVVHAWHVRHPAQQRSHVRGHQPEINISSIYVGGDVGGLIFVVGSVAIVLAGVPMARWFVPGVALGSVALAWGLARHHAAHPDTPLSISTR
jgi:hypothetical protein